jgi:PAS domain S-box-containing protein
MDEPPMTAATSAVLLTAVERAPVGVGVCDQDGRFVLVNQMLARLLRRRREDLIGQPLLSVVHPDELEQTRTLYVRAQVLATAEHYQGVTEENELRVLTGDGESIWVHVSWTMTAPDADGAQYAVVHVSDLTQRRVVEDEVIEVRQHLRQVMEKATVGIMISDLQKNILYANRQFCDMIGYTEAELQRMKFTDITASEDRERTADAFALLAAGRHSRHQTLKRYVRSDGQLVYCRRIAMAAVGRDGAPRSTIAFIEPIGMV